MLARAGGGNNAAKSNPQPNEIPSLPMLDVTDADVTVADNQQHSTTIEHLQITGRPDGALVWQYHAAVPNQLDLTGKLAPGGARRTGWTSKSRTLDPG